MKKTTLSFALVISLYSCNNAPATNDTAGNKKDAPKTEAPVATGNSLTGRWHQVDVWMQTDTTAKGFPTHDKIKESVTEDTTIFEFKNDGNFRMTMHSFPPSEGKYTQQGNTLETTDEKGKITYEVEKLTDKELSLKIPAKKMTLVFEKM